MTKKEIALRLTEATVQLEIALLNNKVTGNSISPINTYDNILNSLNKDK